MAVSRFFRNSEIQEFRSSGVQEFRSSDNSPPTSGKRIAEAPPMFIMLA